MILDHYAASAFNVCKLQPQSKMSDLPPVKLDVNVDKYIPQRNTQAGNVPLHLEEAAKNSIEYDLLAGTLEKIPMDENTTKWGVARQVVVAKPSAPGEPAKCRRTVDYKMLNAHINPSVYHMDPPLKQAERIKSDSYKTVLDARDGFHSIPLDEASRKFTHFITKSHGILRYTCVPQGCITSPAAFNERMDVAEKNEKGEHMFPNMTRLMDDTCLYENTIEEIFKSTCKYLTTIGRAGISFSPSKFQFAKREVDYVGFRIHPGGLSISPKIIKSLKEFPRPQNLTDMRSFMGLAEQTAPFLAKAEELHPFRELLKSKSKQDFGCH